MDKRIPHRLREIRLNMKEANQLVTTDSMRDELCRRHPEYVRLKQQSLRRMIAQELSVPLQPAVPALQPESEGAFADRCQNGGDLSRRAKKRKRCEAGASAEAAEAPSPEASAEEVREPSGINGSLRKMYNPGASAEQAAAAEDALQAKAARTAKLARQRAAMAQARKENGLPDPHAKDGKSYEAVERPEERLEDLGGIDGILEDLKQLCVYPLTHPEVFGHLGVKPPTGVLLHGPPGSGKSKLAHALAGSTGVPFFKVAATEIVSGHSGESEANIRGLFKAAMDAAPSLLFLDEIDAITPKRDSAGREMERRIVAQMLTCMDDLQNSFVIVLAATNRPDALDPALRRAGRFDREVSMGIPDEKGRLRILEKMCQGMRLAESIDLKLLAQKTPGYVGADLAALTKEAALSAMSRAFLGISAERLFGGESGPPSPFTQEELVRLAVEMSDFLAALGKVQPSARREGFTTVPDVKWEDVGALDALRQDLDAAVCEPIRKAELFKKMGLTVPAGVLLFGPPGCGKTLLAKAVANASGANFIAIKGPELLNKYVGESERAVRVVFQRALSSAPCVVFFDELDAMVPKRSSDGSNSSERVVNQMLTEMDGVQQRAQVFVIAATNRPDIIDPAMLRPGRLDRLLFVPLPTEVGRLEILRTHSSKLPLGDDVDLAAIAREAEGFSGADLAALVREAAMLAIRDIVLPVAPEDGTESAVVEVKVTAKVFAKARDRVSASVSKKEREDYDVLASRIASGRPDALKDAKK